MRLRWIAVAGFLCASAAFTPLRADKELSVGSAEQSSEAAAQCSALAQADFSSIPDAPTQITSAGLAAERDGSPGYCEVAGHVTPNTGFRLRLPASAWNGKFIELGCGGFCGSTDQITQCDVPLRRGYACIVTDTGHKSTAVDARWANGSVQAQIDFGFRATHVTALVGKAVTERFYNRAPTHAYFHGCSTGGRQAMIEAQRFPSDFDGIIAGAPVLSVPQIHMSLLWGNRALRTPTGELVLKPTELDLLNRAVLAKCDLNDGVRDGLIGDPRACGFDPAELQCSNNSTREQDQCLAPTQVEAARKMYAGPVTSKGTPVSLPGALKGSERGWLDWPPNALYAFVAESFRNFLFSPAPSPTWRPEDFDFDRDYERLAMTDSLSSATNPDLRRFEAAGGKLLAYAGWSDVGVTPLAIVDYYETAERTLGGREGTQKFFRLFMVPGMGHCTGGNGPFAIDYLSALETWVEHGQAPDTLLGAHIQADGAAGLPQMHFPLDPSRITFTRPLYPYPTSARYLGRGDPADAASFRPTQ